MKLQSKLYENQSYKNVQKIAPLTDDQKAKELKIFNISHDSVVATILLEAEEQHRLVRIWWGDEGQNTLPHTIDLRKERLVSGDDPLPRNTFRLQHIYDATAPKRKIILVQTIDNRGKSVWENRVIEIETKYKFICYPIVLEIYDHFDSEFETISEFDIKMIVNHDNTTVKDEHWSEDIKTLNRFNGTIYPIIFTIDNSGFNLDISYSDDPIFIDFFIKEEDNLLKNILKVLTSTSEFDTSTQIPASFHPQEYTGSKDFRLRYDLNDGMLKVLLRTEMKLIVPIDKTDELLVQA